MFIYIAPKDFTLKSLAQFYLCLLHVHYSQFNRGGWHFFGQFIFTPSDLSFEEFFRILTNFFKFSTFSSIFGVLRFFLQKILSSPKPNVLYTILQCNGLNLLRIYNSHSLQEFAS